MHFRVPHNRFFLAAAFAALAVLTGCQAGASSAASDSQSGAPMTITITSDAFKANEAIPKEYTADGADRSPPLEWSGVPSAAKELALICDDPDAPSAQPWVHWVMYNIPAGTKMLAAGIPQQANPASPAGAVQGTNSFRGKNVGYRGPAPPKGKPHHYHFHLYAIGIALPAAPGLDKEKLLAAIQGHVIAQGELIGTYERQ